LFGSLEGASVDQLSEKLLDREGESLAYSASGWCTYVLILSSLQLTIAWFLMSPFVSKIALKTVFCGLINTYDDGMDMSVYNQGQDGSVRGTVRICSTGW